MICSRCFRLSISARRLDLFRHLSTSTLLRSGEPKLSTPVTKPGEEPEPPAPAKSICREGTVLRGLNFIKGAQDPVALRDDEYPEWLWTVLESNESASASDAMAGDEFSKSKKERRLAAKAERALEAKRRALGIGPEEPKIPLQHQSINLPGSEGGSVEENMAAADRRDELRRAMRRERRAKFKETNFLKTM